MGKRIKIVRDMAGMLVYLHTSFPVAIVHRDVKPSKVYIDQNGNAKLFDFSAAIKIPVGESEVEDHIQGTFGFLDPEYVRTSRVTTKTDVYSFGIILLMLLTGKSHPSFYYDESEELMHICEYIERHMDDNEKIIDCNISHEVGMEEFQAIKDLALSCTEKIADFRPEMLDVARRLHDIEKKVKKASCKIVSPLSIRD